MTDSIHRLHTEVVHPLGYPFHQYGCVRRGASCDSAAAELEPLLAAASCHAMSAKTLRRLYTRSIFALATPAR